MKILAVLPVFLLLNSVACNSVKVMTDYQVKADAPLIVYKMKKDYHLQVPISLNSEKNQILSYPHPSDLTYMGNLALPDRLIRGYWLDNRGVSSESAFIDYTYYEYSKLSTAPSLQELYLIILEKDPFVEMYDCGFRKDYKDPVKDLNRVIKGGFEGCRRLK